MNKLKYLMMDVDGTLTDGTITMGEDGELSKNFNVKDGYGIYNILPEKEIVPVIITGRQSGIVERRCKELDITHIYQGIKDKQIALNLFLDKYEVEMRQIAYIGDDMNDFDVMQAVKDNGGIIGCPQDATNQIKKIADFISCKDGGKGAVREFIEYITAL